MKLLKNYLLLSVLSFTIFSCDNDDYTHTPVVANNNNNSPTSGIPVANDVTLEFKNTFKDQTIVLGEANSTDATINTSAAGQIHQFSELKYVVSNIRLIRADETEVPYNVDDLDKGATVIDQSKTSSLNYVLSSIPSDEYKGIKFGLGIKTELNTLDQVLFPKFYEAAGANDTQMMWEWGTGYRFTKIEGFYDTDKKQLSIHTGSTVEEDPENPEGDYIQGVDAYRDITLDFPNNALVGKNAPKIIIKADFDKLLNGASDTITLSTGKGMNNNATPSVHTAVQMTRFVNNLGGNGTSDLKGVFSIYAVEN
ncbi:MAG: hypothetical protein LBP34_05845 [Flavobacteriaceae bacterium]|nr:hypothetical protein [Flavobacteriaceae bacterium]